jgi:hypothetical protein
MSTKSHVRFWVTTFGVLAGGALVAVDSPASDAEIRASVGCPAGEVVDDEVTGFRCVPQCPSGMMIDAQSHVCVAAPGVPPALPEVQIAPTPQI